MAYNAQKNAVFFERLKNWGVAMQNLREEAARLQDVFNQEARPGGQDHEDYVDTDIATKAEVIGLYSYMTEFRQFNDGNGPADAGKLQVARWGQLMPFIDTTPA
jgi:hypothetical protein